MTMKGIPNRPIIIALMLLFASCYSYRQVPTSLQGLALDEQYVILHQKQKQWFIYDALVTTDSVSGTICTVIDRSLESRFVNVYVTGGFEVPPGDHVPIVIPAEEIISVEENQRNPKKSFIKTSGTIGFFILVGVLIALVISS